MLIAVMLLIIFIIFVFNSYMHYGKKGRLINLIPGPPGYPIVGNAFEILGSRKEQWDILIELTNRYHPIYKLWASYYPVIMISHPDDVETILSNMKHLEKSKLYDFLRPWIGSGLATSKAVKWYSQRKTLTPTFHFNILQQFVDVFVQEGENMTKILKNSKDTVVNDVLSFVSEYTLNAICETAMGTSLRNNGSFQQQYREAIFRITEIITYSDVRGAYQMNTLKPFAPLETYLVPVGTILQINIYGVNRNPNFWPNPEVFHPNRFLPEKNRNRHPYSYITFSAGPRNCIGQRFAMLEMKTMIASLVHNFYLEPVDYLKNLPLQLGLILRLSHPLRIKFVPLKGER
ncbi:PREDICTED: cytochrome P450 4C1-like [Cyphomyrmex costatus]|uniref:cytochrome P450 4C1-like n=1 Tax=Cyphomyrmex costatus TaxID=456900 RepID=UPI00085226CB|nr:PREDICTED: cytochrome P450 4C1-like [Cyphomyrmex costatus]